MRIGVDVGGTFTDIAVLDESTGGIEVSKVLTTAWDPVEGIVNGTKKAGVDPKSTSYLIHGTTVATNAVIQRNLPKTALIATKGFSDVLEIMRGNRPTSGLFDIRWRKPAPLIPRYLRFEVDERVDRDGNILRRFDENGAWAVLQKLKELKVQAVAICFLFSNVNPSHEVKMGSMVHQEIPGAFVSLSSEVDPQVREYERMSTTVIDSSVKPVVADYLTRLQSSLSQIGFDCELMIMRSSGGVMSLDSARGTPVHTIESGPAGGVVGAANHKTNFGNESNNLLSIDMGGTTFKVSISQGGSPRQKSEGEIEWGIPYRIPMIDLSEVGTGGGSIAWIDRGGLLKVGPQSAGAKPGPICYGLGGTQPTFTDACLVLGRISPDYLLGGDLTLNKEAPKIAIQEQIAKPLGMDLVEAAAGIVRLAEANMLASMRVSSVERGYDPRDFHTIAFGGAGPLVATNLARELGSPFVIIPPHPGIFSATGMLYADLRIDLSATFVRRFDAVKMVDLNHEFKKLERKALAEVKSGFDGEIAIVRTAKMRYVGQNYEVTASVPSGELSETSRDQIVESFNTEHRKLYGHAKLDEPIEIFGIALAAVGTMKKPVPHAIEQSKGIDVAYYGKRNVFFEEKRDFVECPVYSRRKLGASSKLVGPCIIEEMDSTTVVRPGQTASIDSFGNIGIEVR